MKNIWLTSVILLTCSHSGWAIYGPSLTRADASVGLRACQESNFTQGREITNAERSGNSDDILRVLGDALKEWQATPATSVLYPARAFCIHELIPSRLPPSGEIATPAARQPTDAVRRFQGLGIEYVYYSPDAEWTLREDPVDLNQLAKRLDSPWGRRAFLMMTQLGWSQGACQEGPDQFREVIKHGEKFLQDYPKSEVSDGVRLELANAYATWWNVSLDEANEDFSPEPSKVGAEEAKHKAIQLYQEYLNVQKTPNPDVRKRLRALQENPKGSSQYDYYCPDYED
jgi:hypothetical protein